MTPDTGAVGSTLKYDSVTPCPAGTQDVDVSIFEQNAAIPGGGVLQATVEFAPNADGSWSKTDSFLLAAPSGGQPGAVPGNATFLASCFNGPNNGTSQDLLDYQNVSFTIT